MLTELSLDPLLLKATQALGFENATQVQEKAIPAALNNKDLLVSAATGSGKTAAFLLPVLQRLLTEAPTEKAIRAIVLVPVRELADQIAKACDELAQFTEIKTAIITGGKDFKVQQKALDALPEIIIATPGRLLEHLANGTPDLTRLDVLILDEADRMLDMGFQENVMNIVKQCPEKRQTLLFSATLPSSIRRLSKEILIEPESVMVDHHREQHDSIRQQIILADDDDHKEKLLRWLLDHEKFDKAIIFTNSKVMAGRLDGRLRYHKYKSALLHGDVEQKGRLSTIEAFRHGRINVLVATDIASRGLDVKGIDLIINFSIPRKGDIYVHRIGRTGRAGGEGRSISLISQTEWNLMSSIERYLKLKFERRVIKPLEGTYKGPKKLKASGKAATTTKKKKKTVAGTKAKSKKVKKKKKS